MFCIDSQKSQAKLPSVCTKDNILKVSTNVEQEQLLKNNEAINIIHCHFLY